MFYRLRGELIHKEPGIAVVECGGVGYRCLTTSTTLANLPPVGEEVKLYTHLSIRENDIDLFGFGDKRELSCFKMLISVSGIGPKMGLSILSTLSPDKVALAIAAGDYKMFTNCQGVGKKTAERILLELRDKIANDDLVGAAKGSDSGLLAISQKENINEAMNALLVLGYSRGEAATALSGQDESLPVEDLIRQALRALAAKK